MQQDRLLAVASLARSVDFRGLCRETVGAFEPHVPWTRAFLAMRRDCYDAIGDARLARATRDLNDFLSHETVPLASGIQVTP